MLRIGIWRPGGGLAGGLGDPGAAQTTGVVFKGNLHEESLDFCAELAFLLGDSCALHWESLLLCCNLFTLLGELCVFLGESCALCEE